MVGSLSAKTSQFMMSPLLNVLGRSIGRKQCPNQCVIKGARKAQSMKLSEGSSACIRRLHYRPLRAYIS